MFPEFVMYTYAILIGLTPVAAAYIYVRARPLIAAGKVDRTEVKRFVVGFSIAYGVSFSLLGLFQFAGGFESPFALYCRPQSSGWLLASWFVVFAVAAFFVWWVCLRGGDQLLYKLAPVLNLPSTPGGIRWFCILLGALVLPTLFTLAAMDLLEPCDFATFGVGPSGVA